MAYGRAKNTAAAEASAYKTGTFDLVRFKVETDRLNQALSDFARITTMAKADTVNFAHLLFLQSINKLNKIHQVYSKHKKRPLKRITIKANMPTPKQGKHRGVGKAVPTNFTSWKDYWDERRRASDEGEIGEYYSLYATFGAGQKRSKFPFDKMKRDWGSVLMTRISKNTKTQKKTKAPTRLTDITYRGIGMLSWISHRPPKVQIPGVSDISNNIKSLVKFNQQSEAKARMHGGFSTTTTNNVIKRTIWNDSMAFTKSRWDRPKINMTVAMGRVGNGLPAKAKAILNKSLGGQKYAWRG